MKSRITLSLTFALLVVLSAPARADLLTGLLVDLSGQLLSSAGRAAVTAVKEAVVPKESAEDRAAREEREVNSAAEQILAQYPEDQRDGMRADVVNRLALIYAKYNAIEDRQQALLAEQNSFGNAIASAALESVAGAVGNQLAIEGAARSAVFRSRF